MQEDYLTNYIASNKLAKKIQNYWHDRGFTGVHVYVEKDNEGHYVVRSNIVFSVKDIDKKETPVSKDAGV